MEHKVLVVDDDELNREIVAELIDESHELEFAESGLSAIEIALTFRPDLVLLDIMMPGMDGYETCRRLKEALPLTKVILVSAKAMPSERRKGYDSGADDYITKPFDPFEFQAKVDVFLRLGFVEEIARTKSDLLVLLSHETRTPLSYILSCAELLEMGEVTDGGGVQLPTIIRKGAERLQTIFAKSMELFSIESDLKGKPRRPIPIQELLSRAGISGDCAGSLTVSGDRESLEQAFAAIAGIFARETECPPLQMDLEPESGRSGGFTRIRITDKTRTISPEDARRFFDLFSVEDVDHHNSSALDFDLPICAAILQEHGGSISIKSDENGNLICEIHLPHTASSSDSAQKSAA